MILATLRRLFSGHYFGRVKSGANRVAWRVHTDTLNARVERLRAEARDSQAQAARERGDRELAASSHATGAAHRANSVGRELGKEQPGVERRVKTR